MRLQRVNTMSLSPNFGCSECEKVYASKKGLRRHKKSHHSLQTTFVTNIPDNSPVHYKDGIEEPPAHSFLLDKTSYPFTILEDKTSFPLGENVCLYHYLKDIYILRKRQHMIRIHKPTMRHLLDIKSLIDSYIHDYLEGKKVKCMEHLSDNVYLIIRHPYKCVDVRLFWTIPNTEQLVATKFGIPLTFGEYRQWVDVLEKNIFSEDMKK